MTIWCSFDVAGRSWVKLKKYQKSLREQGTKFQYKRSGGNSARTWRHRKVRRAYQNSWDSRCQLLFCCVNPSNRKSRSSFADIARVLSEFFRDLDVVPSDVVVGLVLLRKRQQLLRFRVVLQPTNSVYQFLSGVRITPQTQFLDPTKDSEMNVLRQIHHYMHFAIGVYGWPMYLRKNTSIATCRLCSSLRCLCLPCCNRKPLESVVMDDNCCGCNFAAYARMCPLPDTYVVYITYHVDVGETPFLVAIDYAKQAIVLSIRGTLSLKDVITDLNAEGEPLPIRPVNEEWIGHKGMVDAAAYIYKKLKEEHLLTKAFNWDKDRGTHKFGIVCVGHSLGAGTATILAIILKQEFPNTTCYAYSPPGGLLSQEAVEYSKSFVTSVVLGKDVVPRIGLHQLEALRHDLIYAIHKSTDPKWKTLTAGMACCGATREEWTAADVEAQLSPKSKNGAPKAKPPKAKAEQECTAAADGGPHSPDINIHPWDSTVNLSVHQPLYPPGKIVHVVRYYPRPAPNNDESTNVQPIYKAIWADNRSFDEVLISKRMVQDHMPDNVLDALDKLVKQPPERTCHLQLQQEASVSIGMPITIQPTSEDKQKPEEIPTLKPTTEPAIIQRKGSSSPECHSLVNEDVVKEQNSSCQKWPSTTENVSKTYHSYATEPTRPLPLTTTAPTSMDRIPRGNAALIDCRVDQVHLDNLSPRHVLSSDGEGLPLITSIDAEDSAEDEAEKGLAPLRELVAAPIASPDPLEEQTLLVETKETITRRVAAANYDTTYPAVFSGQTEYGQQSVHIEPFYRYRVYSDA